MNKQANMVIGTWSWGVGGFAGGDTVFGNSLDTQDLVEVVDLAIKHGLNTFDTAFAYANGQSEMILGQLLSAYPREQVVVSTKFTPQMANEAADNPMLDMLAGSLTRMNLDFIDIYWIHNSSDVERWTPYLVDAVKTGKIGRIGVSNHNLEQIKRVQDILAPHGVKISAVQNHFSLLYRQSIDDGLLAYCQENDIEFFSYMVLEQGVLSGKYDENHLLPADSNRGQRFNAFFPQLKDLLGALKALADNYEVSPAQVATAWAIAKGTTPIIGVTKTTQVLDAVGARDLALTEAEVAQLEALAVASGVDTRGGWEGQA